MKKSVCRVICLLLCCVIGISLLSVSSVAASSNRVYAETITVKPGETVKIPVLISKNTGLMGFSIVLTYDKAVFTPESVEKGSLITTGLFDDSLGTTDENSFKVVWSGTGSMNKDGELFTATFKTSDKASGENKIKISYEKQNTFDESYNDVKLNCEDIIIQAKTDEPQKITFWQRITRPFVKAWNWIKNLFRR